MVDFVAFSSNSKRLTFIYVEEKISIGRGGLEVRKIILHSGCISLRVYHFVNLCVVSKRRDLRVVDGVGVDCSDIIGTAAVQGSNLVELRKLLVVLMFHQVL
jgi:hypothetical protein